MVIKLFITGTTGYVGGTVLHDLLQSHPHLSLSVLVRTAAQAAKINAVHPTVETLIGDFDSQDLLISTAAASDIVLHIAGDFEAGILSLLEGIEKRPPGRRIFFHISGSGSLIDHSHPAGLLDSRKFNDGSGYKEIFELPDDRLHVALERKIIRTSIEKSIKTAILAPGMILGNGTGTWSTTTYSHQYAREVLRRGKGFLVGDGNAAWGSSSIEDISSAITFILNETLNELEGDGKGKIEYGSDGYYFVESGESTARERAEIILRELKKLGAIESEEIDILSEEEVKKIHPVAALVVGTNSRFTAERLPKLGWVSKADWKQAVRKSTQSDFSIFKERSDKSAPW